MSDLDAVDMDFRTEFEALLEKHVRNFCADDTQMPVVMDWVLVIAIDDAASPETGGHYLGRKQPSHMYRSKGLLHHGLDMLTGREQTED